MPKATIELEIPDGYEFDRYDYVKQGEFYIGTDSVPRVCASKQTGYRHIIVRKVEPVTELAVRFKPGWIAMDECELWAWYENMPAKDDQEWFAKGKVECLTDALQMPAVTDWKQSLMRVG